MSKSITATYLISLFTEKETVTHIRFGKYFESIPSRYRNRLCKYQTVRPFLSRLKIRVDWDSRDGEVLVCTLWTKNFIIIFREYDAITSFYRVPRNPK